MKEKDKSYHHARDRVFYTIFSDKELFRYFLRDFVKESWTAEKSFDKKVEKYDLLKKYIPKFEYKLISVTNIKNTNAYAGEYKLAR